MQQIQESMIADSRTTLTNNEEEIQDRRQQIQVSEAPMQQIQENEAGKREDGSTYVCKLVIVAY